MSRRKSLPENDYDRAPSEGSKPYHYFTLYLDLRPTQSVAKVREKAGVGTRILERYAERYRWRARAVAFDADQRKEATAVSAKRLKQVVEKDRVETAAKIQSVLVTTVAVSKLIEQKPDAIARRDPELLKLARDERPGAELVALHKHQLELHGAPMGQGAAAVLDPEPDALSLFMDTCPTDVGEEMIALAAAMIQLMTTGHHNCGEGFNLASPHGAGRLPEFAPPGVSSGLLVAAAPASLASEGGSGKGRLADADLRDSHHRGLKPRDAAGLHPT